MIPSFITKTHILEAMRRIIQEGVPTKKESKLYCVVKDGLHFPPKHTIAVAHQVATGRCLSSNQFAGGREANNFLKNHGFHIVRCGGSCTDSSDPITFLPTGHSERCSECKIRVLELLENIYGTCLVNHKFFWRTHLSSYAGTPIHSALQRVAAILEKYRGFGFEDFVRTKTLPPCDYWVPDPGFIVEFDESQHFTNPRKLALSAYPGDQPLGFSREHWVKLCEQHDAKDNDPPYRDEQRAWYDTLRDLAPPLHGCRPTVRLHALDSPWCSLDANSSSDRRRFSVFALPGSASADQTTVGKRTRVAPKSSSLRVALIFPKVHKTTSHGVPPEGPGAQEPDVPTVTSFHGEAIDFALFPEGYILSSDGKRVELLSKLATDLKAPLLVGAVDKGIDSTGRAWQVLYRFDPEGSPVPLYTKHSTADAVAFEKSDWEPDVMLPTFDLGDVRAGATICHDQYLGLLPRFLAKRGAHIWVNPSFDNVTDIKWSSILRLRAVENRFFALCTLHDNVLARKRTHPFGFSPDGNELSARRAGSEVAQALSECREPGNIYIVDLNMSTVDEPLNWSQLPPARKPKKARNGEPKKPVCVALRGAQPAILGCSGWQTLAAGCCVETSRGAVYSEVVPKEQILDPAACFRVLDRAKQMESAPIIWNHWHRLPTDSSRLATLMMGRAIECCAPILISDADGIHELVELSNKTKIPARRMIEKSREAIVDIGFSWGQSNAFKIVTKHLPRGMKRRALERYRKLL